MQTDDEQTEPASLDQQRCFALTIAYDGTRYAGWQIQPNGVSIQHILGQSLGKVLGHRVVLHGSGRTDAGVHAQGQIGAFRTSSWNHEPGKLVRAINQHLPKDISVLDCHEVVLGFDPIRNAVSKTYRYTIRNSRVPDPLKQAYHWWIPRPLDPDRMQMGADRLVGTMDFKAFESLGSNRKTSVRTVHVLRVTATEALAGREVQIEIQADGFLYNMVRNITGALVEIGKGRLGLGWLDGVIESRMRDPKGQTAPARGLCLMHVQYPESLYVNNT